MTDEKRERELKYSIPRVEDWRAIRDAPDWGERGSPEVQENFVNSCVDSATEGSSPADESDAERICGCMYDELKARMSFEEFKAADNSLRQGEQMSAGLAATLQAAATACA